MTHKRSIIVAAALALGCVTQAHADPRPLVEVTADVVAVRFDADPAKHAEAAKKLTDLTMEAYTGFTGKTAKADDPELARIARSLFGRAWQGMEPAAVANQVDAIVADGQPAFLLPAATSAKIGLAIRGVPAKTKSFAEARKVVDDFIAANPQDPMAAGFLVQLSRVAPDDATRTALEQKVMTAYPTSGDAQRLKGETLQTKGIGKPFDLAFKDFATGREVSVQKDYKDKIVIVDFWATWCGPCVASLPELKQQYAKYKAQGVEIIGISLDNAPDQGGADKLKAFLAANPDVTWPQFYQGNGWESAFSKGWGINAIPAMFLIDADGTLYSNRARGQIDKLVPELIAKRNAAKKAT